jgi:O-antigen ligase
MIIFIAFCYISSLWAIRLSLAIDKGTSILKNSICIWLMYLYYQKQSDVKHFFKVIMYGGYGVILLSVFFLGLSTVIKLITSSARLGNDFLNANTLGMLAAFTVTINIYFVLYYNEQKKSLPLVVVSIIVLAAAGSRKSMIELVLGVVLISIMKNYSRKRLITSVVKIIGTLAMLLIIGYFLSSLEMFSFINTRLHNMINQITGSGTTDYSVRSRALLNSLGIELFKEHPMVGLGMDCARIPAKQLTGKDWYLHNNFLEMLADGGIIGFTLFYSVYMLIIVRFVKYKEYRDAEYDICFLLTIIHMILGAAYVSYYDRETYFYLMLFFLETEILKQRRESNIYEIANETYYI